MRVKKIRVLVAAAALLVIGPVLPLMAQTAAKPSAAAASAPLAEGAVELHPWQTHSPHVGAEAYFTNLASGDKIETPFLLKFGLSGGWGLAPIAKPISGKSGHHHLLVNRDLPLDFKQALPFTDQYIHFGKGQMETVLNLAPGNYKLRLLLADEKHLPHFVYSAPMNITVTKKNDVDPKSLVKKGISIEVAQGALKRPFRVQFHASGLNVAHQAQQEKDTGHFRLTVSSGAASKSAEMDFVNGQTEVWLQPPTGNYALKLDFLDNANPGKMLVPGVGKSIDVQ